MLLFKPFLKKGWLLFQAYFNTSYVVVQDLLVKLNLEKYNNFNTSYVVVQEDKTNDVFRLYQNFNTSYVVVQGL